jgi:sulfatase maturation enzyme AslB (radical SAM superfamily)
MKSTICPMPFAHQHIETNGEIKVCCAGKYGAHKDTDARPYSIQTHSLSEAWNSEYLKKLRLDLIAGKEPDDCSLCWDTENPERTKGASIRLGATRRIPISTIQDRIDYAIAHNGELDQLPYDFQIMTGNLCNLACKMCGPRFSSQWSKFFSNAGYTSVKEIVFNKDSLNFGGGEEIGEIHDWPITHPLRNIFENTFKDIKYIFFTGGEPTLILQNIEFLEFLIEKDVSKNIELRISTNCTNINKRLLDTLSKFKQVNFNLSIDGIGDIIHIQRYPSNWAMIEKNVHTLLEWSKVHPEIQTSFCINYVWSSLNFHQLNEFLTYVMNLKVENTYTNVSLAATPLVSKFPISDVSKAVSDKVYEEFLTLKSNFVKNFGMHKIGIFEHYMTTVKFADTFENIHFTLDVIQRLHPELDIKKIYNIYY